MSIRKLITWEYKGKVYLAANSNMSQPQEVCVFRSVLGELKFFDPRVVDNVGKNMVEKALRYRFNMAVIDDVSRA